MDIKQFALHMLPYWILGISVIIACFFSEHKDLLAFKPKSFFKFVKMMAIITLVRVIEMHFFPITKESAAPILQLPLVLTGTVFWEDAVHILPLLVMKIFLGDKLHSKVLMFFLILLVQFAFMTGHIYQGMSSAILISFYIPVVYNLAKKHGLGTVMLCHMLYDFTTLLTVRLFLGM